MAGKGTPATVALAKQKVAHRIHGYDHDPKLTRATLAPIAC